MTHFSNFYRLNPSLYWLELISTGLGQFSPLSFVHHYKQSATYLTEKIRMAQTSLKPSCVSLMDLMQLSINEQLLPSIRACHLATIMLLPSNISNSAKWGEHSLFGLMAPFKESSRKLSSKIGFLQKFHSTLHNSAGGLFERTPALAVCLVWWSKTLCPCYLSSFPSL